MSGRNRNKSTALVVGNNTRIQALFMNREFEIIYESKIPHLKSPPSIVVFTGGEDVDPSWYGEPRHFRTMTNKKRDSREMVLFERYIDSPKVGICRGGQFLNVLSGGKMWQHVAGHTDNHKMIDLLFTKKKLMVTSTHHQMMLPSKDGVVLAVAQEAKGHISMAKIPPARPAYDPEVVWYPKTNSLCFQPHPEYSLPGNDTKHTDLFFDYIDWAFKLP
jgi:carbamoylphosphate synthase small subunit